MADRPGFSLDGEFYEVPQKFDLDDGILIEQLAGYDLQTFLEEMESMDPERPKITLIGCLLAVAVRQAHPNWPKGKILRLVGGNTFESIEFVSGEIEVDTEEADAGPPEPQGSTEPNSSEPPPGDPKIADSTPPSPQPSTERSTAENESSERSLRSVTGSPV